MPENESNYQNCGYERLKEKAVFAAITLPTIEEAAKDVGVSVSTLYRWMEKPDFKESMKEARRQIYDFAVNKLQQATLDAADILITIARNESAPASARVSAVRVILENSNNGVEIEELTNQLKKLEEELSRRSD